MEMLSFMFVAAGISSFEFSTQTLSMSISQSRNVCSFTFTLYFQERQTIYVFSCRFAFDFLPTNISLMTDSFEEDGGEDDSQRSLMRDSTPTSP